MAEIIHDNLMEFEEEIYYFPDEAEVHLYTPYEMEFICEHGLSVYYSLRMCNHFFRTHEEIEKAKRYIISKIEISHILPFFPNDSDVVRRCRNLFKNYEIEFIENFDSDDEDLFSHIVAIDILIKFREETFGSKERISYNKMKNYKRISYLH